MFNTCEGDSLIKLHDFAFLLWYFFHLFAQRIKISKDQKIIKLGKNNSSVDSEPSPLVATRD